MDIQALRKMRNSDFGAISNAPSHMSMIAFGDWKVTKQVMAQPHFAFFHE